MLGIYLGTLTILWGGEGPQIFRFKKSPQEGSTSREAQDAALQAIPWERLDASARAKVQEVVSQTSVFRRMPLEVIQCDPQFFLFCVHHPEVVVNIWQVLGVSRMKVQPIAQGVYQVDDSMGTQCQMQFLFQSPEVHLIYAEGSYEGPLWKRKVYGRGLLILHSPMRRQEDGRTWISCRLDMFLQMEPGAVEVLTKTLHPLMGRVSDYNFKQTARFVEELWLCARRNPGQLERLACRLPGLKADVRQEFIRLTQQAALETASIPSAPRGAAWSEPASPTEQPPVVQTGQAPTAGKAR